MGLLSFISGGWRTPKRGEVYANGAWRRLSRGEAYISGQWCTIASFIQPLTLTANNINGYSEGRTYVEEYSTATPRGGLAPYRYQWTLTSGSVNLTNTTQATVKASATVPYFQGAYASARVVCTDALGTTASADISIYLYSERNTGNQ